MHGLEREVDALCAVPCKQGDDCQQHELAERVPGEGYGVRIVNEVRAETDAEWSSEPGHDHKCRSEQRRKHAAGTEHKPEYRSYGALHCDIISAIKSSRSEVSAATMIPAAVMSRGST